MLYMMQLDPRSQSINLHRSLSKVEEKIQAGYEFANQLQNRTVIAVMGTGGSGKSILINDLCGCDIQQKNPKEFGVRSLQRHIAIVKPPAEGGVKEELVPIHHENIEETIPSLAKDTEGNIYCEFPGFFVDSSFETNIARAITLPTVLNSVAQLKIVILISYSSLLDKKIKKLSKILNTCSQLFGSKAKFQKHLSSILLGINQVPSLSPDDERKPIKELKQYIVDTAENDQVEILSSLTEKLFIYAPIQIDSLCYDNTSQREDILLRIKSLTAINPPVPFQTAMTDEDLHHVDVICRAMGQQIAFITEKQELTDGDFQRLSTMKQLLTPLALLGQHPDVEIRLENIQTILTDHFKSIAGEFNRLCDQEDIASFKIAQAMLKNTERGLRHFDPSTRQFLLKLFEQPLQASQVGITQLMGLTLVRNATHSQRMHDLVMAVKEEAERLGDRLQAVVSEFETRTREMSKSLHALAQKIENECRNGDLSSESLSKAYTLLSLTQFTKEIIHTTSEQCIDLEKKGAHGIFSNFQQTLEVALYARKLEIDFISQKLELLDNQLDHEWMIFIKGHSAALREEVVLFDQLLQLQEQEQMTANRGLHRESEFLQHKLREQRLNTEMVQQEEEIYTTYRRRMVSLQVEGLKGIYHLDAEARCQLTRFLANLVPSEKSSSSEYI